MDVIFDGMVLLPDKEFCGWIFGLTVEAEEFDSDFSNDFV